MASRYFTPQTFGFLRDLAANNDRGWFKDHQADYERLVRQPALDFIQDAVGPLRAISPHLSVESRKVGGSLFRIQRDTRFSGDKAPYKTHTGMHFRHLQGGDVHTAGFYVHLEPGRSFMAAGMWRPTATIALAVRQAIAEAPGEWTAATRDSAFSDVYRLEGDSLVRPPRGFDPAHPLVEDLKRKDFAGTTRLTQRMVVSGDFFDSFIDNCTRAAPLLRFLCNAVSLPF